jgi:hypothetical protein
MASKKATIRQLLEALAKERGIDVTDLDKMKGSGVMGRLQEGAGFGEAFAETGKEKIQGVKDAFSKKGMKSLGKKAYMTYFGGSNIFSAYMRGRLNKKTNQQNDKEETKEQTGESGLGGNSSSPLKVIAKNSNALPGMARDMNVLRQNVQKLVEIWGGESTNKKETEREGDKDYFEEQDKREEELEAARQKDDDVSPVKVVDEECEEGGGLIDKVMSFFSKGFMKGIKFLFSPKTLMSVMKKVFLPIMIIGTLFKGITDGFKKYQETGSFSEAIVAGLGGMLSFLTFGLFGEDTLRNLFQSVSEFFAPITDTISNIFSGIKNFIVKLFGGKVDDEAKDKMVPIKPEMPKVSGDTKPTDSSSGTPSTGVSTTPELPVSGSPQSVSKTSTSPESSSPTRTESGMVKKHKELLSNFSFGDNKTSDGIDKEIGYLQMKMKDYSQNRDKAMQIGDTTKFAEYDEIVGMTGKRINDLMDMKKDVSEKQVSSPTGSTSSSSSSASASPTESGGTGSSGGGSVSASPTESGGTGSSGGGSVSASPSAPSGGSVSEASSEVAEGQRMESAADSGSVVNSPTTNNTSGSTGDGAKPKAADVYDSELADLIAYT